MWLREQEYSLKREFDPCFEDPGNGMCRPVHFFLYASTCATAKDLEMSMNLPLLFLLGFLFLICPESSGQEVQKEIGTITDQQSCTESLSEDKHSNKFDKDLPTVGVLIFDGVLMTEVTAPVDVFSKPSAENKKLFNVVMVAASKKPVSMESGMRVLPDYTFTNCPKLEVLIVPSSFEMEQIIKQPKILKFIQTKNQDSKFTMSNCAGAYLLGASGVADGKKIVTYIGGGEKLKELFPKLSVQDDAKISFVKDGKLVSSNGNLASYLSALEVLEEMTNRQHRKSVEDRIYLSRLQNAK